jgi:hypothetical protein
VTPTPEGFGARPKASPRLLTTALIGLLVAALVQLVDRVGVVDLPDGVVDAAFVAQLVFSLVGGYLGVMAWASARK